MVVRCLVWILALDGRGVRGIYQGRYFFRLLFSTFKFEKASLYK
jgi:hypothetical protein